MTKMNCAKSEQACSECSESPNCRIYSERVVLVKQLKKLRKIIRDIETILERVLGA